MLPVVELVVPVLARDYLKGEPSIVTGITFNSKAQGNVSSIEQGHPNVFVYFSFFVYAILLFVTYFCFSHDRKSLMMTSLTEECFRGFRSRFYDCRHGSER